METLRKTVRLGGLTYFLYALISWLDLGAFIPPFPLFPFLISIFIFFFWRVKNEDKVGYIYLIFSALLVSLLFIDQLLVELFLNYSSLYFYISSLLPLAKYLHLFLAFFFTLLLTMLYVQKKAIKILLYVVGGAGLIMQFFYYPFPRINVLFLALLLLFINRMNDQENRMLDSFSLVLNGISILILIDFISFQLA